MSEPIKIPAYIDQPPHVMFWRLDEVMPIGIGLVAGVLLAQLILCTVVGLLLARFYRRFTMFSDPACGFCKEIIQQARSSLPEGYRLDVLMLPLLSQESAIRTKELLCAKDKVAAWKAGASGDMKTPLEQLPTAQCDLDVISKRRMTAQFLGARNVPFLIRDDGLTREGKPCTPSR